MLQAQRKKGKRTAFQARGKRALALLLAFLAALTLLVSNHSGTLSCAAETDENGRTCYCGHVAHKHTEDCYTVQRRLVCGREECEGHTHTEDCYAEQSTLVCTNTDPEHVHTEDCYLTERVLICGLEEQEGHVHSDECWVEEEVLSCGVEEHEHTLECYSDRSAVETEADWRASVSPALITGRWDLDLVAVARTQIGYNESSRNYIVLDGVVHGYTRYGDWIDNSDYVVYGPWCASFVAFCMYYANIRNVPVSSNCATWVQKLIDVGMYYDYGEIEPRAGDLVFFYSGRENDAEAHRATHMGIVAVAKEDGLITIEGNVGPVSWREYEYDKNVHVLGFGRLPDNPDYRSVTDSTGRVRISGVLPANLTVKVIDLSAGELEKCGFRSEQAVCAYEISLRLNGEEYKPKGALYVEIRPGSLPGEKLEVIHFRADDAGKLVEYWPVEQLTVGRSSFSYLAFRLSRCVMLKESAAVSGKD